MGRRGGAEAKKTRHGGGGSGDRRRGGEDGGQGVYETLRPGELAQHQHSLARLLGTAEEVEAELHGGGRANSTFTLIRLCSVVSLPIIGLQLLQSIGTRRQVVILAVQSVEQSVLWLHGIFGGTT